MLAPRDDNGEIAVAIAPCHNIHHWLLVIVVDGKSLVDVVEELAVGILGIAADEKCRHWIVTDHRHIVMIVEPTDDFEIAAQPLPSLLQGQDAACSGLEMHVVGSAGTTLRTVVEHHQLGISSKQLMYLTIVRENALWLMAPGRNREVHRQDGERIDEELKLLVDILRHLHAWAVFLAQETGAAGYRRFVYLRSGTDDACGIELHLCREIAYRQLAHLHVLKVVEALTGIVPPLQLAVEEPLQTAVVGPVVVMEVHLLARHNFHCPQPVLIEVVGVHLFYAQRMVGVAAPAPAEV